jgi:hypothetical protein
LKRKTSGLKKKGDYLMGNEFKPNVDGSQRDEGTPNVTPPKDPPGSENAVTVTREEWDAMRARLDSFEQDRFNMHYQQPQPPPQPAGPSLSDQLKTFEDDIDKLDDAISESIVEGKPVKDLMKRRSKLEAQRLRLQIQKEDLAPLQEIGLSAIDQLSDRVTRADMPYYDVVKKDLDKHLAGLSREQRANPEVRAMAYQLAVGNNFQKIFDAEMEKRLREQAAKAPDANLASRAQKTTFKDEEVPDFAAVMSKETQLALRDSHMTPDEYYRKWGYKDGWAEFWYKHKDFM